MGSHGVTLVKVDLGSGATEGFGVSGRNFLGNTGAKEGSQKTCFLSVSLASTVGPVHNGCR